MTTATVTYPPIRTARRIDGVTYAVRDVVLLARQALAAGKTLISLNIGDPCQFDFRTPEHVVEAVVKALRDSVEDVYPGDIAQDWLARWRDDPKVLERELASGG